MRALHWGGHRLSPAAKVGSSVKVHKLSYYPVACGIFWFLDHGSNPRPPALGVQSLSHWTSREVPQQILLS